MIITPFWPWLTRHRQRFEGEAGGEPAGGPGETPSWQSNYSYFSDNPDAVKAFSKYQSEDDAFKGAHEAFKRFGKPYHLPADHSKLTDEQRAEIRANVAQMNGVPESPDGYQFEVPEGLTVDEQAMTEFKTLAHQRGLDPQTAQEILGLQIGMIQRMGAQREKLIQGMTDQNFKTFLNEDCGGDKDVAATRMELVKRFLQEQFTKDGEVDTEGWEKFAQRIYHHDRIIELPLLRALHEAAVMKHGTGGALGDSARTMAKAGAFDYAEMD